MTDRLLVVDVAGSDGVVKVAEIPVGSPSTESSTGLLTAPVRVTVTLSDVLWPSATVSDDGDKLTPTVGVD